MPVKVKICGVRTPDIVEAAAKAGALNHRPFAFFAKSPRHIEFKAARPLSELACGRIDTVAVLVDPYDTFLDEIVGTVRPNVIQLHGSEVPVRGGLRPGRRSGLRVIKAIGVGAANDVAQAAGYRGVADMILFDEQAPAGSGVPGGHGLAFDWQALLLLPEPAPRLTRHRPCRRPS